MEDLDGNAMESEREKSPPQPRFASSKWETVDEAELEAQGKVHRGLYFSELETAMFRVG